MICCHIMQFNVESWDTMHFNLSNLFRFPRYRDTFEYGSWQVININGSVYEKVWITKSKWFNELQHVYIRISDIFTYGHLQLVTWHWTNQPTYVTCSVYCVVVYRQFVPSSQVGDYHTVLLYNNYLEVNAKTCYASLLVRFITVSYWRSVI